MAKCPKCHSDSVRKSRKQSKKAHNHGFFRVTLRCDECGYRFSGVDLGAVALSLTSLGFFLAFVSYVFAPREHAPRYQAQPDSTASAVSVGPKSTSYLGRVQIERLSGAAEEGDAEAQLELATVLADEYASSGDSSLQRSSDKWLRLAAAQGLPEAQFQLGGRFRLGQGVVQDFEQATAWFRQAADQGLATAMYTLGEMIRSGQGTEQNYVDAYVWLNLAAARGDKRATEARDQIVTLLSTDQLNEAQRRSRGLDETIPRIVE